MLSYRDSVGDDSGLGHIIVVHAAGITVGRCLRHGGNVQLEYILRTAYYVLSAEWDPVKDLGS